MDEPEFEEMCRRAGGRSDNLLSGQPRCRFEDATAILQNQSYGSNRVEFHHTSEPIDFRTDSEDVSLTEDGLEMEKGKGWSGEDYWEDATVEISDRGIEIIDAIGARPPEPY